MKIYERIALVILCFLSIVLIVVGTIGALNYRPPEKVGERCYIVKNLDIYGQSGGSGIGIGAHEFVGYGATWERYWEDGKVDRDSCDLCNDKEVPRENSRWCRDVYK